MSYSSVIKSLTSKTKLIVVVILLDELIVFILVIEAVVISGARVNA